MVEIENIIETYDRTRSVWKTGKELGVTGQSVHYRLKAIDYKMSHPRWTKEEDDELKSLLESGIRTGEIGERLNRSFAAVACRMNEKGLTTPRVQKVPKIPRGKGYDKKSSLIHLQALEDSDLMITKYARKHSLNIESLVRTLQRNFPERWEEYLKTHSKIPTKTCEYCEINFMPMSGKQRFCNRQCGDTARRDESYFGGKRRNTIGLSSGICQLCGNKPEKGLSSHHVLGKENDPDNEVLIAICQGCHKLVTLLGSRTFLDDISAWETLITLAILRKGGAGIAEKEGLSLSVYVEIGWDEAEEE